MTERMEIDVADAEALREWIDGGGWLFAPDGGIAVACAADAALGRIIDAIPEPEWEPSVDLVAAALRARHWSGAHANVDVVTGSLKRMHAAGVRFSLDGDA